MTKRENPQDHPLLVAFRKDWTGPSASKDESAQLRASLTHGDRVIEALLASMDRPVGPNLLLELHGVLGSIDDTPAAFPNQDDTGSPTTNARKLYESMWWAKRSLESGGTLLQDSPYRNAHHLVNTAYNAAYQLIAAMSPPRVARKEFDWDAGHAAIAEAVLDDRPVAATMAAAIDRLAGLAASKDWDMYRQLDFATPTEDHRSFLVDLLEAQPPNENLDGFWFGIGRGYRSDGVATYDLWPGGGSGYSVEDPEWPAELSWEPRGPSLNLDVLDEIYDIDERRGELSGAGELVVLAFALCFGRETVRQFKSQSGIERIGVCAGFSGGGDIHLGWV